MSHGTLLPLSGSLAEIPVSQLMAMLAILRRDARVRCENGPRRATLVLVRGEVDSAETNDGWRGEEAINHILEWRQGSFEVEFVATVPVPVREPEPAPAPVAPAPPSSPAAEDATAAGRAALGLLNVVASFAAGFVQQPMLVRKLEAILAALTSRHPALRFFRVDPTGAIGVAPGGFEALALQSERAIVDAASEWILALVFELQRTFPGSFPNATLRILAESAGPEIRRFGFYRALGIQ
ncbi:MAG: DUF4388 domain-containing protein [Thermoanaerobaculia bacterium]|nr:DUF4388 domain-containing protein [Thermoanaerobaculia bacterium]